MYAPLARRTVGLGLGVGVGFTAGRELDQVKTIRLPPGTLRLRVLQIDHAHAAPSALQLLNCNVCHERQI